jgi:hypothetical protein
MKKLTWAKSPGLTVCYGTRRQAVQQAPEGATLHDHDPATNGPAPRAAFVIRNGKAVP